MAYFEINNLRVTHHSFEGAKTVLDIGHLAIEKGETYGLVGESGQGKTVLALTIQQLLRCPPGRVESGEILLDGQDLLKLRPKQMKKQIHRRVQPGSDSGADQGSAQAVPADQYPHQP